MINLVSKELEAYAARHSGSSGALLQEIERYTKSHREDWQMLVGELEGALLALLVRLTGAQRVLEIGCFTGYSALSMAEALPDDGELITCDRDPETARIAQSFFDRSSHGKKIRLLLGEAIETLKRLPAADLFDLAFIDADKENYLNYYELVLPRLNSGGLLVADNVLWSGRVLKPESASDHAIVAFNERVRRDTRVECVLLTVRDGVLLVRKR